MPYVKHFSGQFSQKTGRVFPQLAGVKMGLFWTRTGTVPCRALEGGVDLLGLRAGLIKAGMMSFKIGSTVSHVVDFGKHLCRSTFRTHLP